ncbi:MAG: hypothetical protein WC007_06050 [Pelobacteraceae bacterium]
MASIRLEDLGKHIDKKKLPSGNVFTDKNIQAIFGHEAADDEDIDRLKKYFVKNIFFEKLTSDLKLRIAVGHKGIGKSALFRIAASEDINNEVLPIFIKPDDIIELKNATTDFLKDIRKWKEGLRRIIYGKILDNLGVVEKDSGLLDYLLTIGGKVGGYIKEQITDDEKPLNQAIEKARGLYKKHQKVNVYIDDLDRGWKGREEDISMISALMNAVRDISNEDDNIHFKIALRSDVYFLFRRSDESTDKVGGSVFWLSWSNHEILALLVKRIGAFWGREVDETTLFQMHQAELAKYLDVIISPVFEGAGHWENAPIRKVLLSLIRKRPRDIVKLCTLAAQSAYLRGSNTIETTDWEDAFPTYSNDRLLDTEIEYKSELPELMRLMLGMKPSVKKAKARDSYEFTTDELLKKIEGIEERGKFAFSNGKSATTEELAHFLYKINFITARRKNAAGKIVRKYFEDHNYLMQPYVDFGFSWEVHPAYRWALQPDDPKNVYLRLELLDFE